VAEIPEKTERTAIVAAVGVFKVHSNCNVCNRERGADEVEEQTDAAQNGGPVEINIRTRPRVRGNSKDNRKVNNARRCGNATENEAPHASELLHLIRRGQTEAIIYRVIIQNYDRHTNDIFI